MEKSENREFQYTGVILNGFVMLLVIYILLPLLLMFNLSFVMEVFRDASVLLSMIIIVSIIIFSFGFFTQQPNESRVMVFFGKYKGTLRNTGFFWVNPLMNRKRISLRLRNIDIEPIKVNDKSGNPVMIGMVLVWKVEDTYRAVFDVDSEQKSLNMMSVSQGDTANALARFVGIQSDAALREVASRYAYDETDSRDGELTLRSGGEEINELLEHKINERLSMAGITVVEARLNYLAYAPEIAAVMLRRQQATAIITAREKIVEGAVSMVKMALDRLKEEAVVELDDERKATMVSNLLVVLCADEPAQPVVNAGTLYQ
ncbi:SPFH domain-containing protein [Barnesiella sp. WM24]|uniref:SPFH domain-containing protein n=1 Tax=Barnesiella sp. WM24 TaxID=2558278 RepID=UPI001072DB96|nr:SPFH domain-containing protein [Barnesiella sp. WM24]TFU93676.1 SPFH domain-containing protein [Barnesiella sp. WM24]